MFRRLTVISIAFAVLSHDPSGAAVRRKPASARKASPGKVAASTPTSVFGVDMRPMTTAEADANAIWNLRAALNIAALQCQYSPFLATVNLYNGILQQHADEIDRAKLTMMAHFRHYDGARGMASFDQYTTKTYNAYSTLDAQLAFCDRAGIVGRELLAIRKGQLAPIAHDRADAIRASLVRVKRLSFLGSVNVEPIELPEL